MPARNYRIPACLLLLVSVYGCGGDDPAEPEPESEPLEGQVHVRLISTGPLRDEDGISLWFTRESDFLGIEIMDLPPGDTVEVQDTFPSGHYDVSPVGVAPGCVLGGAALEGLLLGRNHPIDLDLTLACG